MYHFSISICLFFCIDMNIEAYFYRYINISDINDSSNFNQYIYYMYYFNTHFLFLTMQNGVVIDNIVGNLAILICVIIA